MNFLQRPLAFTDVETTGLEPIRFYEQDNSVGPDYYCTPRFMPWHEIIEIGLVVADQKTLSGYYQWEMKIKPAHLERMSEKAREVNGYKEANWQNAATLKEAMRIYSLNTIGAVFCNHNVGFDWSFIDAAFKMTGVENKLDYHRIDIFTLAYGKLKDRGLDKFNLDSIAEFLGLGAEQKPHRAINGAMKAYEVYKKLMSLSPLEA